uniref:Uncharacterized protein n=2 Tax=Physcomitrium patens TaxID=3218 RepID=A0A2K1L704_PHYPA|nr:hypothetical protein PHYPA_000243 [Physcomitrium patens]
MKKAAAIEPQEFVHLSKTCTKCVEPVKEPLRQSGYSACDQDEGLQLPCEYVDGEPCLSNTVEWAVACERDQWSRAIAGRVNVAPRHLSAEAETLLSATLIHEGMHGRNKPNFRGKMRRN